MAIQPIDVQVLFSRLNQIGREQAVLRDAQAQAQAVAGSEIAERSEEQDHRVSELRTDQEGPEAVDEDGDGGGSGAGEEHASGDEERSDQDVIRDPDLGQHVDLSG
ncbi:MAG: hypothetical protein ACOCY8_05760 [Spirochaetota bacterium]